MSSFDYRWLGSTIARALRDDHLEAARRTSREARARQQIEHENSINAERRNKVAMLANAATATGQTATTTVAEEDGNEDGVAPTAAAAPPTSIVKEGDPVLHLSSLVDPSSFFPPDKSRPFTSVRLVGLSAQQDWSAIQKRAAKIAELRKTQLSNAYQTDVTSPAGAGATGAQQRAYAKRQQKMDRKRMRMIDREKREKERIALQKVSSMVLSPLVTSSEESSSEEEEEEEHVEVEGARHTGGKKKVTIAAESDSEEDGPPPDAEEIQMRMQRAAWKRTRDILSRTLNSLNGVKSPVGASRALSPSSPPPRKSAAARPSIMISNDRRVQGVYASVESEMAVKNSAEHKIQMEEERIAKSKARARRIKAERIARAKERMRSYRTLVEDTSQKRKLALGDETSSSRMVDRSQAVHSPSPTHRMSRAHSAMSLAHDRSPSSSLTSTGGRAHTAKARSLAHSDSAPVIAVGGHVVRATSPSRWPKSSITSPAAAEEPQPASGSLLNFNTPMMARRRARGILPPALPLIAAPASQPTETDSGSDAESDTFMTQVALSSTTPATPTILPFSVPEYGSSSPPLTLPPSRSSRLPPPHTPSTPQQTNLRALTPTTTPATPAAQATPTESPNRHIRSPSTEEYRPTLLQPITSIVRSFSRNPLDAVRTSLVIRPGGETEKVMRRLQANLAAADEEIKHMLTAEQKTRMRTAEMALLNDDPFSFLRATAPTQPATPRLAYARRRHEKGELASKIMMSFSHTDMRNISEEIVRNGGTMTVADFIRTTRRKQRGDQDYAAETEALAEMFREIDVNGDGTLSFLEFTSYLVELAHTQRTEERTHLHHEEIPASSQYQTLEDHALLANEDEVDYSHVKWFDALESFVVFEKDQVRFKVLNKSMRVTKVVRGHTMPLLAVEYLPFHQMIVTSAMDRTMKFWSCNWDKEGQQQQQQQQPPPPQQATHRSLANMSGMGKETLRMPGAVPPSRGSHRQSVVSDLGHIGMPGYQTSPLSHLTDGLLSGSLASLKVSSSSSSSSSARQSPLEPTYAEIASWRTPLPQHVLTWNKTRLYSSDTTGRIIVWNVDSGDTRVSLNGHELQVNAMIPVPDMLASAADDCMDTRTDAHKGLHVLVRRLASD